MITRYKKRVSFKLMINKFSCLEDGDFVDYDSWSLDISRKIQLSLFFSRFLSV